MDSKDNAQNLSDTGSAGEQNQENGSSNQTHVPSQETDPVKVELERINKGKPEKVKLRNTLIGVAKRARELGIDPEEVIRGEHAKPKEEEDDNTPLTKGDLKRMESERAQQTAMTLADAITDEHDRELTKYHLENTIKPSGNAETDLKNAQALVNSIRNGQIAEEAARKVSGKSHSSAAGAPAKSTEAFQPTAQESYMMKTFGLTQEDVISARRKEEARLASQ